MTRYALAVSLMVVFITGCRTTGDHSNSSAIETMHKCDVTTTQVECQGLSGCYWNAEVALCQNGPDCARYLEVECPQESHCQWSAEKSTCVPREDLGVAKVPTCGDYSEMSACVENKACHWDSDQSVCLKLTKTSDCSSLVTPLDCQEKEGCWWDAAESLCGAI